MTINQIIIFTVILVISMMSCNNSQKKTRIGEAEPTIKADSVIVKKDNDAVKKLKNEDKYPRVLTYTDIIEKNKYMLNLFEESKSYSLDTIAKRVSMNQSFNNYLSTQFKYMLSPELRLLRNEFFARKGYKFKSKDLTNYFSQYSWYNANIIESSKIELSSLEKNIIDTIKVYEKENKNLNANKLKKTFRDYCKNNVNKDDGYYIEIPSILFRRNIGFQIKGLPEHNKNWFNGTFLRVQIIDTLKNNNLLLGLFGQIMCPDQYCLYGGEIVTCDSLLNYIDSESIEFESYKSSAIKNGALYTFEAPNSSSNPLTILRIEDNGQIFTGG